jgi:hypothetical protein
MRWLMAAVEVQLSPRLEILLNCKRLLEAVVAGVSTFISVSSYFKIDYFVRNSSFNVACQLLLT